MLGHASRRNTTRGYVVSVIVIILWGRSSDAFGGWVWRAAMATIFAAGGLIVAGPAKSDPLALAGLACGINGSLALFGGLPRIFLGRTVLAGGIALINVVGNLSGFPGPYLVGSMKKATGLYAAGMGAMAACLIAAAVIVLLLARSLRFKGRAPAFSRCAPP
jgi:ACS family tartrate transporter-like MFS transporter